MIDRSVQAWPQEQEYDLQSIRRDTEEYGQMLKRRLAELAEVNQLETVAAFEAFIAEWKRKTAAVKGEVRR